MMEAPALAAPTLAEEPPSQPAPVRLPETPVEEEVADGPRTTAPPRRKPMAPAAGQTGRGSSGKNSLGTMLHHTSTRSDDAGGAARPATPRSVLSSTRPARGTGATFSFSSYESLYACGVCGAEFKEVVDAKNGVISSSKFVGDLVCFCGRRAQCLRSDPNGFMRTPSRYPGPRPPGALG